MNKRGIELSVNFLVMLIISIVIFGSALYMVKQFFQSTKDIQSKLSSEVKKEIERRLVESAEQVSIPLNKAVLGTRASNTFGLGILNMLGETKTFSVKINFDSAYTKLNEPITLAEGGYIDRNWIFTDIGEVTIANNDFEIVSLPVVVDARVSEDSNTLPGIYVFNVCVFKGLSQKCERGVTNLYPDGKISKIYVEVD